MKKFFKSLALVLALTLVIGTIPASAASTDKVSVKKSTYKAVVGTQKTVANLLTGVNTKTQKVTFSVADEAVAEKISSKKMEIKKMGTTTVTIKVWDKATNKVVNKFNVAVTGTIKATAETVTVEVPATVKQGETVTVKAPKNDSYARTIEVKDAEGKAVEATRVDKSYAFTFVAEKAGEYTVTISTSNGVKVVKTVTADSTTPEFTGVKQTASNGFAMEFTKDPSSLNVKYDDIDVYYLNAAGVKISYSKVAGKDGLKVNAEKALLNVSTYSDFVKDREYFVALGDKVFSFKGADVSKVAYFTIDDVVCIQGVFSPLSVSYYNDLDMKIANPDLVIKHVMTYEKVAGATTSQISGNQIYFAEVGDTADVRAYYVDYSANSTGEKVYSQNVVTLVGRASKEFTGNKKLIIKAGSWEALSANDAENNTFFINDTAVAHVAFEYYYPNLYYGAWELVDNTYSFESSNPKVFVVDASHNLTGISEGTAALVLKNAKGEVVDAVTVNVKAERYAASFTAKSTNPFYNIGSTDDSTGFNVIVLDQYGDPYKGSATGVTRRPLTFSVEKIVSQTGNFNFTSVTGSTTGIDGYYYNGDSANGNTSDNYFQWDGSIKADGTPGVTVTIARPSTFTANKVAQIVYRVMATGFGVNHNETKRVDVVVNVANYTFREDNVVDATKVAATQYKILGAENWDLKVNDENSGDADKTNSTMTLSLAAYYGEYLLTKINTANGFNISMDTNGYYPTSSTVVSDSALTAANGGNYYYKLAVTYPWGKLNADKSADNGVKVVTVNADSIVIKPVTVSNGSIEKIAPVGAYSLTAYKLKDTLTNSNKTKTTSCLTVASGVSTLTDTQPAYTFVQKEEAYVLADGKSDKQIFIDSFKIFVGGKEQYTTDTYRVNSVVCNTDANNNKVFTKVYIDMDTKSGDTLTIPVSINKVVVAR